MTRVAKGRKPSALLKKKEKSARDVVGVVVGHGARRPRNADPARGPDSEQRAFMWSGEPPPLDKAARRRTYDMNKKLADDLGGYMAVEEGCFMVGTPSDFLVGKKKGIKDNSSYGSPPDWRHGESTSCRRDGRD